MALGFSLTHPAILTICMDLYFRTRKLRLRDNTCIPIPWNRGSPGQMTGEQGWNPPLRAYHVALPPALPPQGFPGGSDSKDSACNMGGLGTIPGLGRSPRGGHGNPLQYSCLENPMDRRAWWATLHGVSKDVEVENGKSEFSLVDWCFSGLPTH